MPFAVKIEIDQAQLNAFAAKVSKSAAQIRKNVAGAITDTAKHEKTQISTLIRENVNIKKADVEKFLHATRATPDVLSAEVILSKSERIPLKYFGARQTNKGVTYKIAKSAAAASLMRNPKRTLGKSTGGRERIADAFGPNIPRLGGNVFRRLGKKRLPIIKLLGPSAWGVFTRLGLRKQIKKDAQVFLNDRLKHRVLYQK